MPDLRVELAQVKRNLSIVLENRHMKEVIDNLRGDGGHSSDVKQGVDNDDAVMILSHSWEDVKCKNKDTKFTLVKRRPEDFIICERKSFFALKGECVMIRLLTLPSLQVSHSNL